MFEYLPELMKGLHTSLTLTVASIIVALILALIFTIILTLKTPVLVWLVRGYITLFTGTPLLVQIFLIYYGWGNSVVTGLPGTLAPAVRAVAMRLTCPVAQQRGLYHAAVLWRDPCDPGRPVAVLRRAGDEQKDTTAILLPYAFKRALSSYSNEVVLVFKSTSLAYTITLMEVMVRPAAVRSYLRCDGIWRGWRDLSDRQWFANLADAPHRA